MSFSPYPLYTLLHPSLPVPPVPLSLPLPPSLWEDTASPVRIFASRALVRFRQTDRAASPSLPPSLAPTFRRSHRPSLPPSLPPARPPSLPPSFLPSLPVEGFIVLQSQLHQLAPNQNVRLENCRNAANSHSLQMRSLLPSRSFKSYIGWLKTTDNSSLLSRSPTFVCHQLASNPQSNPSLLWGLSAAVPPPQLEIWSLQPMVGWLFAKPPTDIFNNSSSAMPVHFKVSFGDGDRCHHLHLLHLVQVQHVQKTRLEVYTAQYQHLAKYWCRA